MSNLAYRGRHRPRRSARTRQAAFGAGLALPTTATLVTIAVAGSGAGAMSLTAWTTQSTASSSLSQAFADPTAAPADALVRAVEDRAARDSERRRVDLVAGENTRRATTEAALAAHERVLDVSTVVPAGGGTEGAAAAAPAAPAAAPAVGSKSWVKPLNGGYRMTSGYGARWGGMHPAQDFATPTGSPVRALSSGTVIFAGYQGSYGYKLEIQFWDGTVAWYAHNSSLKVRQGQSVTPGQLVAASGNTGNSTGPHLHLEIHPGGGDAVSPLPWLSRHGIKM